MGVSVIIIYYAQTYMAAIGVPVSGCATITNLYVKNNTQSLIPSNVDVSVITPDAFLC